MEGSNVQRGPEANILGKYRLIAELGHGGMAEVYLAVAQGPAGFNKLVVIKQIRPQLATDPEFLGMFLDEARLAARLSHPNVVQTNEVGQDADRYFIAMEYLEGQPLNRILHRVGRDGGLTLGMHLRIIVDMLAGLHHAHELTDFDGTALNVVHRDVTPHNVFVTYDGQVKVVDFGIAKAMNSSAETRLGVVKGKVAYMAPEQARGERVDRRADIFSAGVMLWEAATGRRLWKGIPDLTVLHRLINGDIPSPRSVDPNVPEGLEKIVMKALALRREDRYATSTELATALEELLDEMGDKTNLREVGKLVAKHFEDNRQKIKQIVENQLKAAKSMATTEFQAISLPVLDGPSVSGPMSVSDRTGARESGTRSDMSSLNRSAAPSTPSSLTASTAAADTGARPQPAPKRGLLGVVAVLGVAAAAGAAWFMTRPPPQQPTTPAPAVPATAAPQATDVELKILPKPADAKVFIDGKQLSAPYVIKLPKGDATHSIEVKADGYIPYQRDIILKADKDLEIPLTPTGSSVPADPKDQKTKVIMVPPPTTTGTSVTDDPMKAGIKKPNRNVDTTDPYKQ